MEIWDESETTDVKKDSVITFVIFDDDLQVLIRIFLDGFVVSVEEIATTISKETLPVSKPSLPSQNKFWSWIELSEPGIKVRPKIAVVVCISDLELRVLR